MEKLTSNQKMRLRNLKESESALKMKIQLLSDSGYPPELVDEQKGLLASTQNAIERMSGKKKQ